MKPLKVIYIHGFNSSGRAKKSQILRAALQQHAPEIEYYSPTLQHQPKTAMLDLQTYLDHQQEKFRFFFVGSSLGGFFAIYLVNRYCAAKAALINPALNPWESMHDYYGHYENKDTGEKFEVTPDFVSSLKAFGGVKIQHQECLLLLLQTDDDVIDYRQALRAFPHSSHIIRSGGGHTFTDFAQVIPDILQFMP